MNKANKSKVFVIAFLAICGIATGVVLLGGWATAKEVDIQQKERELILAELHAISETPDEAPEGWVEQLSSSLPERYEVINVYSAESGFTGPDQEPIAKITTPDFQVYTVAIPKELDLQEWRLEPLNTYR